MRRRSASALLAEIRPPVPSRYNAYDIYRPLWPVHGEFVLMQQLDASDRTCRVCHCNESVPALGS